MCVVSGVARAYGGRTRDTRAPAATRQSGRAHAWRTPVQLPPVALDVGPGKLWPVLTLCIPYSISFSFRVGSLHSALAPYPPDVSAARKGAAMIAVYTLICSAGELRSRLRARRRGRVPRGCPTNSARAITTTGRAELLTGTSSPLMRATDACRRTNGALQRQTGRTTFRHAQLLPPLARMRRAIHTRKIALPLASIRRKLRPLSTCTPHVCTSSSASS